MTGFIRGIFGSKNNDKEKPEPKPQPAPRQPQNNTAYFLDADDAKSYGNLSYMRESKTIRRTFPKTAGNPEEKEYIVRVSSMGFEKADKLNALPTPSTNGLGPTPAQQPLKPQVDEVAERRKTDTSMDMFRNMARDIRKK